MARRQVSFDHGVSRATNIVAYVLFFESEILTGLWAVDLWKQRSSSRPTPNPNIPSFGPGDTVRVNFRIREGDRERVQAFQGVVIRLQNGKGPEANFTVRRISAGIGIERIFPLHSPLIDSLEVTRRGLGAEGQALLPARLAGQGRQNQGEDRAAAPTRPRLRRVLGGVLRTAVEAMDSRCLVVRSRLTRE